MVRREDSPDRSPGIVNPETSTVLLRITPVVNAQNALFSLVLCLPYPYLSRLTGCLYQIDQHDTPTSKHNIEMSTSDHTFRRIVTTHHESDTDGSKVQIYDDTLPMRSVLDGDAHMTPLFASLGLPAKSAHHIDQTGIKDAMALAPSVVTPNGVNGQVTDLAPNAKVGMHRTNSIDYNVILKGSVWLITPSGDGKEERIKVHAGEVVVQRGTIHAWEATEEGARWCTVIVSALPVEAGGKPLEEVDF